MSEYEPELGQFAFGNPTGRYNCPEWVEALFFYIKEEMERVYWNVKQEQWDGNADPGIPLIEWRPYYWGDDETEAEKPNFRFSTVEFRWYKNPGRGMSLNCELSHDEWIEWFELVLEHLRKYEKSKHKEKYGYEL